MHFHSYFNDISTRRVLSLGLGRSIGPNWHRWTHNCRPICAVVVMTMPYLWAFSSIFPHMSHKWGLTNLPSTVWSPIKNIPTVINYLFTVVSWNSVPRSLLSIIWLRARAYVFMWTRALAWKCHRSLPCSCRRRSGCGAMTPYWSLERENKQMPQGKPHLSTSLRAAPHGLNDWIPRMPLCMSLYIGIVFLKNVQWGWFHFAC